MFITSLIKLFNLLSAASLLSSSTPKYILIFGSVPEGLTQNQDLSLNVKYKTLDFGKLVFDTELSTKFFISPNL